MPRQTIFRSQQELEEIKRIRRKRNTEIQRARRQKLREMKKEKEILTNNLIKSSDLHKQSGPADNNQIKEKRKKRNTELQRLRRANLYIPRRNKIIENEEDYLARRRKRNTEIQRLRRQKLKQQREEKELFQSFQNESNCSETNTDYLQDPTAILTLLQACLIQLQTSNNNNDVSTIASE